VKSAARILSLMAESASTAQTLDITWDAVLVTMADNRVLRVPYEYDERIDLAAPHQRMVVEIAVHGQVLFWPALDVALSLVSLMRDADEELTRWAEPPIWVR
jgi:hypothetical protein